MRPLLPSSAAEPVICGRFSARPCPLGKSGVARGDALDVRLRNVGCIQEEEQSQRCRTSPTSSIVRIRWAENAENGWLPASGDTPTEKYTHLPPVAFELKKIKFLLPLQFTQIDKRTVGCREAIRIAITQFKSI
ncbi:hypothetical protein EVAR_4147_1 [Eumeta japonica]|uniref:Uncharacterized protein n=1 Tax=Eumeta variegata TaxID=151549 RepID=A0A4C1TJA5_EUMVA|nr:hypothetical protein EVAR_4147_1 [Eumeta japonica]